VGFLFETLRGGGPCMKKVFFFLTLVPMLFILSCNNSGSSSGGSGGTGSIVQDLHLGQNRAVLGQGGGMVTIYVNFNYLGGEGDLTTYVFYYDNNGNPVYGTPAPIRGVNGSTHGSSYAYIDLPTVERKTITIRLYVIDGRGRTSNLLATPFDIL
jgi:hypothetical protein